jgi:hypothetical protein
MRLPPWLHPLLLLARRVVAVVQGRWFPVVPREPGTPRPERRTGSAEIARGVPLRQPTRTTCGSSVLVVMDLLDGGPALGPDPLAEFATRVRATIRRTNSWRDRSGRLQLPWPHALGTRPAALVRELGGGWVNRVVDPRHPDRAWEAMRAAGRPVPLYVGEGSWMQHIVLVVAIDEHACSVYDPGCGDVVSRTRAEFETASLHLSGWDQPWLVILPTPGASRR